MITLFLATGTATASAGPYGYGLGAALREGGLISQSVFSILMLMSIISCYILLTKLLDQQKIIDQANHTNQEFWSCKSLDEGTSKLNADSPFKQLVDDSLKARDQHLCLAEPIMAHSWMYQSLARSTAAINSKLDDGLAFLATVGATAPFIGLFGTVIGIYRALVKIAGARRTSIDAVAGPVGEALIMTALGLVVAVPAVISYNWLQRRNKLISKSLGAFSDDLLSYHASSGAVRPSEPAA